MLTVQLGLVVALECVKADFKRFFALTDVIDHSLEGHEISLVVLVRLNFSTIGVDNSISDTRTQLANFVGFLMLTLDFLIVNVLALVSLLLVLLVKAKCLLVSNLGNITNFLRRFITSG